MKVCCGSVFIHFLSKEKRKRLKGLCTFAFIYFSFSTLKPKFRKEAPLVLKNTALLWFNNIYSTFMNRILDYFQIQTSNQFEQSLTLLNFCAMFPSSYRGEVSWTMDIELRSHSRMPKGLTGRL